MFGDKSKSNKRKEKRSNTFLVGRQALFLLGSTQLLKSKSNTIKKAFLPYQQKTKACLPTKKGQTQPINFKQVRNLSFPLEPNANTKSHARNNQHIYRSSSIRLGQHFAPGARDSCPSAQLNSSTWTRNSLTITTVSVILAVHLYRGL